MPLLHNTDKPARTELSEAFKILKSYKLPIKYLQTKLLLKLSETELVLLAKKCEGDTDGFWMAAKNEHGIYKNKRKSASNLTRALNKISPHNKPPEKNRGVGVKLQGTEQANPIKVGPTTYKVPKPKATKPFLRSSAPQKKRQMTIKYLQRLKDLYKRLISVDSNIKMFVSFEEHTTCHTMHVEFRVKGENKAIFSALSAMDAESRELISRKKSTKPHSLERNFIYLFTVKKDNIKNTSYVVDISADLRRFWEEPTQGNKNVHNFATEGPVLQHYTSPNSTFPPTSKTGPSIYVGTESSPHSVAKVGMFNKPAETQQGYSQEEMNAAQCLMALCYSFNSTI